jgi:hypothetical protein
MKTNTFLMLLALAVGLLMCACALLAASARLLQFRGPGTALVADDQQPSNHFWVGRNEHRRTAVPSGASSPCVWDDRILLAEYLASHVS